MWLLFPELCGSLHLFEIAGSVVVTWRPSLPSTCSMGHLSLAWLMFQCAGSILKSRRCGIIIFRCKRSCFMVEDCLIYIFVVDETFGLLFSHGLQERGTNCLAPGHEKCI